MKHQLSLEYNLSEGWLAAWVEGLRTGEALASHCSACDTRYFPPLRVCADCRARSDGWVTLSGRAKVIGRTNGRDGDFVLAQFEGAKGAAVMRASRLPKDAIFGQLCACGDDPLALELKAERT